jgi:hypothetical protein
MGCGEVCSRVADLAQVTKVVRTKRYYSPVAASIENVNGTVMLGRGHWLGATGRFLINEDLQTSDKMKLEMVPLPELIAKS